MTTATLATGSRRRWLPHGRVAHRLRANRIAMIAFCLLVLLVLVGVFAPQLAPYDPNQQELLARVQGPGAAHWLGTDSFGRDSFSRLLIGTRTSLAAAALGLGVALVLGLPIGLLAGFVGRWFDSILSRVNDGMLSIPPLILALAIVGVSGPGLTQAMVAVGIVLAPRFFRVARSAAQSVAREMYIEAARAEGCSYARLLLRYSLPNASGPLLVQISFSVGYIITAEASLSYLGLGVRPPTASWGGMLNDAFKTVSQNWFPLLPPVIVIAVTVAVFSIIGDALRDALGRDSRG